MRTYAASMLIALALLLVGCGGAEGEIANYIEDATEIMEDNLDSPEEGVDDLVEYLEENLPTAMSIFGEAMVELNRIEKTSDRKERLKEMLSEIEEPMKAFTAVSQKFAKAVKKDDDASEKMERLEKTWDEMGGLFEEFGRNLDK